MASPNRYSLGVRCICKNYKCRKRITLRKAPELYMVRFREVKKGDEVQIIAFGKGYCACGAPLRIDQYRQSKRERRTMRCFCGVRPWKHTKGPACRTFALTQTEIPHEGTMTADDWAELAL